MPTGAIVQLETFVLMRPRDLGAKVFWALSDVYTALQLKSFSGQPSKWVYNSWPSWQEARAVHGSRGPRSVWVAFAVLQSCGASTLSGIGGGGPQTR